MARPESDGPAQGVEAWQPTRVLRLGVGKQQPGFLEACWASGFGSRLKDETILRKVHGPYGILEA